MGAGRSASSAVNLPRRGSSPPPALPRSLGATSPGRLALFSGVRYLVPVLTLLALAASPGIVVPRGRLVALLTAQVAFGLAVQALATHQPRALGAAVWMGILVDFAVIGGLAASTGGAASPLVFLFTLEVLAAGILLSSTIGVRLLGLATAAIITLDVVGSQGLVPRGDAVPRGLQAVAALWVVGGLAILFSVANERELRRRNAELATIRRVTLDIEDTLSLEEILADLCRGVVEEFGFSGAAVLLRGEHGLACMGAHGATGRLGAAIEERGSLREAIRSGAPVVVTSDQAREDGSMSEIFGPRGYVVVPLEDEGALVATRAGRRGRPGVLRVREIDALTSLAHHAVLALANARLHARVSEMAIRDPLTGLANHGEFQRVLAHEVGRLERFTTLRAPGHHLSLLLVDIDSFKALNDRYGHPAGDAVLKEAARAISSAVRSFDVVARYGGEEFAVVLPETDELAARQVAERVREGVRRAVLEPGSAVRRRPVTVSVGAATAPEDGTGPAALIARADQALYRSKQAGRDRVTRASDLRRTRKVVALKRARPKGAGRAKAGQGAERAKVTRRRREPAAPLARAGARRARGPSSRPRPRTPRG